jgi:hypothetical protein
MSYTVNVYSPKGGQGASTVAAALAFLHARYGAAVSLVGEDEGVELSTIFGHNPPPEVTVGGVAIERAAVVVIDRGVVTSPDEAADWPGLVVMVLRPCYLALRRAVAAPRPDFVVLIEEPQRAIGAAEVREVVGPHRGLITVPFDPAVARAIDAGLLSARLPKALHPLTATVGA